MRGYLSFILVLISLLLVLSLLEFSIQIDLSKAISLERLYGVEMNAKEATIEALRTGSNDGFSNYDKNHKIENCKHCYDNFCSPTPTSSNFCSDALCISCFREKEARYAAFLGATSAVSSLHNFDPDFSVIISASNIGVFLRHEPLSKNGFAIDFIRIDKDATIICNSKLGVSSSSKLPKGMVIR